MLSTRRKIFLALALALAAAASAQAQTQQTQPGPSDNYVTNTGFKNRIFEVHNHTPEDLVPVLRLLTSGFKGAQVSASNEFRSVTARDFPENIAAIEEAIKRLDVPEPARPDIELRIQVLLASNAESAPGPTPADLKDVVSQLQPSLGYKNYYLLTTIMQRTKESRGYHPGFLQGSGSALAPYPNAGGAQPFNYNFDANSLDLSATNGAAAGVQLGNFTFALATEGGYAAKIHSDVRVREGERVVVGTAGLKDKTLVLVMTARVLK